MNLTSTHPFPLETAKISNITFVFVVSMFHLFLLFLLRVITYKWCCHILRLEAQKSVPQYAISRSFSTKQRWGRVIAWSNSRKTKYDRSASVSGAWTCTANSMSVSNAIRQMSSKTLSSAKSASQRVVTSSTMTRSRIKNARFWSRTWTHSFYWKRWAVISYGGTATCSKSRKAVREIWVKIRRERTKPMRLRCLQKQWRAQGP